MERGPARRHSTLNRAAPRNSISVCPATANWFRRWSKTCRWGKNGSAAAFGESAWRRPTCGSRSRSFFKALCPRPMPPAAFVSSRRRWVSCRCVKLSGRCCCHRSWKVGEPDGATIVSDQELPLPRPKSALGIASAQTPQFYVSEEGETGFALDCHEVRSHRWPAAAGLLLLGIDVGQRCHRPQKTQVDSIAVHSLSAVFSVSCPFSPACPEFPATLCHCLAQAVPGQPSTPWHTGVDLSPVARNAG